MIPAVVIAESTTGTKRDTATNRAIQRVEDGWHNLAAAVYEIQRAAERVVTLDRAHEGARDQVRQADNPEWVRTEGGPQVFRARVALQEASVLVTTAQDHLDLAVAGSVRTPLVLKLRHASPTEIVARAPAALDEIRTIQDRLLRDPGWWFHDPTPWNHRAQIAAKWIWHTVALMPMLKARRHLRSAASSPWKGFTRP